VRERGRCSISIISPGGPVTRKDERPGTDLRASCFAGQDGREPPCPSSGEDAECQNLVEGAGHMRWRCSGGQMGPK